MRVPQRGVDVVNEHLRSPLVVYWWRPISLSFALFTACLVRLPYHLLIPYFARPAYFSILYQLQIFLIYNIGSPELLRGQTLRAYQFLHASHANS